MNEEAVSLVEGLVNGLYRSSVLTMEQLHTVFHWLKADGGEPGMEVVRRITTLMKIKDPTSDPDDI